MTDMTDLAHVIYDPATTLLLDATGETNCNSLFKSLRAAKMARTKALKALAKSPDSDIKEIAIAEYSEFFNSIEKQEERINAMTGKPFMEPANTSFYCSPRSESYFCN